MVHGGGKPSGTSPAQPLLAGPGRRCDHQGLFERFTEQARQVVVWSQDEARELNHDYIGTEHILLGLLRVEDSIAALALDSLGVTHELVRAQLEEIVPAGKERTNSQIPFTPRAKKVLELSLREALSLGHSHIGPEHILLGLGRENDGIASRILLALDVDAEKIRNEVRRMVADPSAQSVMPAPGHGSGFDPWWIRVGPTASLRRLLMVAAARALDDGRSEIATSDVLLALTRDDKTGPLLAGLGVDEAAVGKATERLRASEEPPEAAAEG